jgi:hypothetical protein
MSETGDNRHQSIRAEGSNSQAKAQSVAGLGVGGG